MTEHDMNHLEGAIGQKLSAVVRTFFLNFPPELRAMFDPYDDDFVPTDDSERLIEANRHYRPVDWKAHMFILGAGSCGETYWVDLNSDCGSVFRFDAGTEGRFSDPIADSLEEWARGIIGSEDEDS